MRVHPGQTLILAGEPLPRRSAASANSAISARSGANTANTQRVTIISARVDALVTDAEYTPTAGVQDTNAVAYDAADISELDDTAFPAITSRAPSIVTSRAYSSYASSSRGAAFGGASAYARTQDLAERHPIIDTYA